jgi:hypothetical protein
VEVSEEMEERAGLSSLFDSNQHPYMVQWRAHGNRKPPIPSYPEWCQYGLVRRLNAHLHSAIKRHSTPTSGFQWRLSGDLCFPYLQKIVMRLCPSLLMSTISEKAYYIIKFK